MNKDRKELGTELAYAALDDVPTPKADAKEIIGLVKSSGKITGYRLSNSVTVSKEEGVSMAKAGDIKGFCTRRHLDCVLCNLMCRYVGQQSESVLQNDRLYSAPRLLYICKITPFSLYHKKGCQSAPLVLSFLHPSPNTPCMLSKLSPEYTHVYPV